MKKLLILSLIMSATFGVSNAQVRVLSSGRVGIGTTNPIDKLSINGASTFMSYTASPLRFALYASDPRLQSDNSVVFYDLTNTGFIDIQVRTVYQNSDLSVKENIVPLTDQPISALEKIKQLKGVSFNWKNQKLKLKQVGFIAQDVEKIIPELVITNDSTGNKSMSYTQMIPYLVEAIKEQQKTIELLKQQIGKKSSGQKTGYNRNKNNNESDKRTLYADLRELPKPTGKSGLPQ